LYAQTFHIFLAEWK